MVVVQATEEAASAPLRNAGCEILLLPEDDEGKPDMMKLLDELGRRRWTNLLVEGGSTVLGKLFDLNAVDEAHVFVAPKLIGGALARTPVEGAGWETIAQSEGWTTEAIENLDGDVYLRCLRND